MRYVEKYNNATRATDDNMAHAHFMLDNLRYRHTFRICNTYYISTAPRCYVIRTLFWIFFCFMCAGNSILCLCYSIVLVVETRVCVWLLLCIHL